MAIPTNGDNGGSTDWDNGIPTGGSIISLATGAFSSTEGAPPMGLPSGSGCSFSGTFSPTSDDPTTFFARREAATCRTGLEEEAGAEIRLISV